MQEAGSWGEVLRRAEWGDVWSWRDIVSGAAGVVATAQLAASTSGESSLRSTGTGRGFGLGSHTRKASRGCRLGARCPLVVQGLEHHSFRLKQLASGREFSLTAGHGFLSSQF